MGTQNHAPPAAPETVKHLPPPKLPDELRELAKVIQADSPSEPVRWGCCAGTEQAPHPPEFYLGFSTIGACDVCFAQIPNTALVFPKAKEKPAGGNGGNGKTQPEPVGK